MSKAQGIANSANQGNFKNRIINGDMRIDQRNAGASYTAPAGINYTIDRWAAGASQASKFTVQQNAGAVTPPVGFTNYLGVTSSSAYTVGTSELFTIQQAIEGFNVADLGWGTADAKTVTLSFWVRSSLTGTFGGVLNNGTNARSYPFTYTISVANTWEQKSVTIAGDTIGTWATTNGSGILLRVGLGVGASVSGTAGSWSGSAYYGATGATSVVGTSGATFYITGVQLEKGSTATSFDYRPYGTELALCQRYYEKSFDTGTVPVSNAGAVQGALIIPVYSASAFTNVGTVTFAVEKRASPTLTTFNPFAAGSGWSLSGASNITAAAYGLGTRAISIRMDGAPGASGSIGSIHWVASIEL